MLFLKSSYLPQKGKHCPWVFLDGKLVAKHAVQVPVEIVDAVDPRNDRGFEKRYPQKTESRSSVSISQLEGRVSFPP